MKKLISVVVIAIIGAAVVAEVVLPEGAKIPLKPVADVATAVTRVEVESLSIRPAYNGTNAIHSVTVRAKFFDGDTLVGKKSMSLSEADIIAVLGADNYLATFGSISLAMQAVIDTLIITE